MECGSHLLEGEASQQEFPADFVRNELCLGGCGGGYPPPDELLHSGDSFLGPRRYSSLDKTAWSCVEIFG